MDFTIEKYIVLIRVLTKQNYSFQTFEEFLKDPLEKSIILRHDVDLLPLNSLQFAKIQNNLGIRGTYYFRAVPESWDEKVIIQISQLGHEIGYHYENLTTSQGNFEKAISDFENNLKRLREIVPVSTICMHGSPMSKYDSRDLWKKYNYRDYDIIGEPYFDMDFNKVFYLTDTGRRWDGQQVSVRDKVSTVFKKKLHSTGQIISSVESHDLPHQIMFTFHPQRWHDNYFLWTKEYIFQNFKNVVKKFYFVR